MPAQDGVAAAIKAMEAASKSIDQASKEALKEIANAMKVVMMMAEKEKDKDRKAKLEKAAKEVAGKIKELSRTYVEGPTHAANCLKILQQQAQ